MPDGTKTSGQIDAFLERNGGAGVQHLAFLVDDILPAVREFGIRGVEFLRTPGAYDLDVVRALLGQGAVHGASGRDVAHAPG